MQINIISKLKKVLYFPIASYFRLFAGIRLKRWSPKIVVVTGSNGKTTLLHLLESQIGDRAKYSHHANSSFGIPFDILGIHRKTLLKSEWIGIILKAPFLVFKKPQKEKLYIVEADCDRPGEGKFLASFLKPSSTIWLSSAKTHSMNFEKLVKEKKFATVDAAIAYEFGYFLEYAKDYVIVNADSELISNQLERMRAKFDSINNADSLVEYKVGKTGTTFQLKKARDTHGTRDTLDTFYFKYLLPEEVFYSIIATQKLCEFLNISFDQSFSKFQMPPGRGSIFKGIKNSIIIDSSYNANFSSSKAVINTFEKISAENQWLVIGDMLELGGDTKTEHEKLADVIFSTSFQKVILMGPRVGKYTYPLLPKKLNVVKFDGPKETLEYILENMKGREIILFKGARFMEGIIEHLLADKNDVKKLPRREKVWEMRRKKWGL